MADSHSESRIFSVRIVSIDYYTEAPIPGYDVCYSTFQGGKVNEVPVIRIYGSTPAGQKTCLHVHQAFPYLYVPYSDIPVRLDQDGDTLTHSVSLEMENALRLKGNVASKRQHVHGCDIVKAKKIYGYHSAEDVFIKIYFYHPHDVGRAADLLLAGAIFGRCLQPYESHIPFILQFLIDYNLYGMGHVHISPIKFRHPLPDTFHPKWCGDHSQLTENMSDLISTAAEVQLADASSGPSLASPVWLSSTVPNEWMWPFSCESGSSGSPSMDRCIRQSVCELEADATVNDILNQQLKMYISLSQTGSDVKMVQSLIPIWKEEFERTGMLKGALSHHPGKPQPEDVLKTLSLDEFENRLTTLCDEAENMLIDSKSVQPVMSSDAHLRPETITTASMSAQNLPNKSEINKTSPGAKGVFSRLPSDEAEEPEVAGSQNLMGTDMEALGLLKWFASSQADEDINSDDELAREAILSPLLPAATIDKVLEKANIEYESLSQKECQDILDSLGDLVGSGQLKERASGFFTSSCAEASPVIKVPRSGGTNDEYNIPTSAPSTQNVLELDTNCQASGGASRSPLRKPASNRTLWAPLPLSITKDLDDEFESVSSGVMNSNLSGTEEGLGEISGTSNQLGMVHFKMKQICNIEDKRRLVGCSVRELMRCKRLYRAESPESVLVKFKRYQVDIGDKEESPEKCVLSWTPSQRGKFYDSAPESSRRQEAPGFINTKQGFMFSSQACQTHRVPSYLSAFAAEGEPPHDICNADEEARSSFGFEHEVCRGKITDVNAMTVTRCLGDEQVGVPILNFLGCSPSKSFKMEGATTGSIGITLSKKPPTPCWDDVAGVASNQILPFFAEETNWKNESYEYFEEASWSKSHKEAVMGVPTHYLNDGSSLYLLTLVHSPPSVDTVSRWLQDKASQEPHDTSDDCSDASSKSSPSPAGDMFKQVHTQKNDILNLDSKPYPEESVLKTEGNFAKSKLHSDAFIDVSQISGPDGKSTATPLSQTGFRDPASLGSGQQLTILSIEVQAESRADLRPDPRFDSVNVVVLVVQNDNDSSTQVFGLLYVKDGAYNRNSDGVSGCKMLVFSEEKQLLSHFMKILHSFDPDILIGWDIQGSSLGYLAERSAHLGIRLLNDISRTPSDPRVTSEDSGTLEKGIFHSIVPEPIISGSQGDNAIIEDEWGRTHASGLHVSGRIVLNVWRLMRGEVKLNMYTIEAVAEAVLRRKIPSIPNRVLTKWFASGPGWARFRCIQYLIQRAKLDLEIMNQLDMINRTSELARVFGIDFFSVLSRGSQYRVESMLLRLAHTQNYLAISPGNQQVASQPAMECLPLVMEPESGFYADPVVVLDFQSLYPSMIIAYNLCFSTCLGKVATLNVNTLGVTSFSPDPRVLRDLKTQILLTPNGVMYVPPKIRKGILPRLLEEILSTRIMVKQAMKKLGPSEKIRHRILNARQLALKLIANVTYGYTAAGFSGRMPCAELADSIVQCGRSTLEKAISFVNANEKWKAKVVYGDTDSMFVLLKGRTVQEAFQIGQDIASSVTAMNPHPVTLKMEKVYRPCFLLTKKRYVGYSYEKRDQTEPVFDAKGIETVRRDSCGAVTKTMEQSLRLFFEHQDISKVKTYLHRQWKRILAGRVSLQDFVFAKEVRLGTYATRDLQLLPPAAIVATKAMKLDPRAEPRYAERVPYVVIHGEPGARLVDMVVSPLDLLAVDSPYRLNDLYYINKQIIPALQRVFGLVGADLSRWFTEMPRAVRESFGKRPLFAQNQQRTRIDFYYLSKHCVLCGELVQASEHLCNKCMRKESVAITAIIGKTSKSEREMQHLAAICRHCGGGDWLVESGVKCTSLACPVFYERRKVQKELRGLSAVAAEKGLYPECMVEWF